MAVLIPQKITLVSSCHLFASLGFCTKKNTLGENGESLTASFSALFCRRVAFPGSAGLQQPRDSWGQARGFPWQEDGVRVSLLILAAVMPTWLSLLPFCLPGHAGCFLLVPPGPGYRHG